MSLPIFLYTVPWQSRLSEAVEAVDGQLDPTSTSDLSSTGLSKLLWVLTRQKPCCSIARLRVKDYAELNARLRRVHERISQNNARMQEVVTALRQQPLLTDEWIDALATNEGFEDEWLSVPAEPKRRSAKASAVPPGQQLLTDVAAKAGGVAKQVAAVPQHVPAVPPPKATSAHPVHVVAPQNVGLPGPIMLPPVPPPPLQQPLVSPKAVPVVVPVAPVAAPVHANVPAAPVLAVVPPPARVAPPPLAGDIGEQAHRPGFCFLIYFVSQDSQVFHFMVLIETIQF